MAELALAVVPLCLSAIKGLTLAEQSFKKLRKLRQFRHEIEIRKVEFITQKEFFLDECQLLLQHFLDREEAESLIQDDEHPDWYSKKLYSQIRSFLGRKYDTFAEQTENIRDRIYEIDKILNGYDDSDSYAVKLKPIEKVQQSLTVAFDTSKFAEALSSLSRSNNVLHRVLDNVFKFEQKQATTKAKRSRPIPDRYHLISCHSKSFYQALAARWSCSQSRHSTHEMRLFLEPETDDSLHVVMQYVTANECRVLFTESWDLVVRSQSLPKKRIGTSKSTPTDPEQACIDRQPKVRKVRFLDDAIQAAMKSPVEAACNIPSNTEALEPTTSEDLCKQLCKPLQRTPTIANNCSAYLDNCDLRHRFYSVSSCTKNTKTISQLGDILLLPKDEHLDPRSRIRLALQLANGVLQYHSTPWLSPLWQLQDLAYFRDDDDLSSSFRTLHINSDVVSARLKTITPDHDTKMKAGCYEDVEAAQLSCGIRNLTLYSLGVAMLQIGLWQHVDSGDVVQVRQLMEDSFPLGERYQRIASKCLWCDFGSGKDLADQDLQSAIYRDVVCELQGILDTLDSLN